MNKVIGIIGSRSRDTEHDYNIVWDAFKKYYNIGDKICSGLCPKGADRFAVSIAQDLDIPTIWFPAEWDKYGRGAGYIRNTDIAKTSDILIACVATDRTGGTEDTIKKFIKLHGEKNLVLV